MKSLTQKSRKTDELQRAMQRLLPSMLADYCQVRSYERGVLTLNASTGSAATQLRFLQQQIFPKLKKMNLFNELEKIVIRVQTAEALPSRRQIRAATPVSKDNCQLIKDAADEISDQTLADSLRRLAITLGKYGKE